MMTGLVHAARLVRAGYTLARHDVLVPPGERARLPRLARILLSLVQIGGPANRGDTQDRLVAALSALGPSYIKLGQFLATRPDIVGADRAFQLRALQDRLPPFSMENARAIIEVNLGGPVATLFAEIGEPVAAASIAQVHRAKTPEGNDVAVKVLRPGIERRFASDLESFYFAARLLERVSAEGRRLRPVAAVATLEQSMKLELDLRMEAAAISEMAANTTDDPGFRLPRIDWQRTGRQVLTTEWIDGTPISDIDGLRAQGFDLPGLGDMVIQSFLRHAIRDGFFHADMHQGNLFVDRAGRLVAVDFGITGRLNEKERQFLAEILYGFIVRDYARVSRVHFEAGYVPRDQDPASFAQALRAIGEPIMGRTAGEISMARLLTQLFEVTGQFNMATQPQLLLLQKTMVVTEGVARTLNPTLNIWTAAEPVVREWIERRLGPAGKAEQALSSVAALGGLALRLPEVLDEAAQAAQLLSSMAQSGGLKLDAGTAAELAGAQARQTRIQRYAMVAAAAALVAIAFAVTF